MLHKKISSIYYVESRVSYKLARVRLGLNTGIKILNNLNIVPSAYVEHRDWTDGTIGCLASHVLLWEECSRQEESYLIIEQDGVLIKDPRSLLPLIDTVCHLDAYLPFDNSKTASTALEYFQLYNERVALEEPGVKNYPKNKFYDDNNITGSCFRGTYGYIITPKGGFIHFSGEEQVESTLKKYIL